MKMDISVDELLKLLHAHFQPQFDELKELFTKGARVIMANDTEKFATLTDRLNTVTNTLAQELKDLRAQSSRTDMSQAEEDALAAKWDGAIQTLETLGADPNNPVPPTTGSTASSTPPADGSTGSTASSTDTSAGSSTSGSTGSSTPSSSGTP